MGLNAADRQMDGWTDVQHAAGMQDVVKQPRGGNARCAGDLWSLQHPEASP